MNILNDNYMDQWFFLLSFTYVHEAYLPKGKLETEGIEVLLKDELTFYSNATGGVRLFVKESDYLDAYNILFDLGYIKKPIMKPNNFLVRFDQCSSKLPLFGKSIIELRLVLFFLLGLLVIMFPVFLFLLLKD